MSKTLEWHCHEYENNCRVFVAKIVRITFEKSNKSLKMNYLIYENYEKPEYSAISLYFECNSDIFELGEYNAIDLAFNVADRHYKKLAIIFKML